MGAFHTFGERADRCGRETGLGGRAPGRSRGHRQERERIREGAPARALYRVLLVAAAGCNGRTPAIPAQDKRFQTALVWRVACRVCRTYVCITKETSLKV